MKALPLNKNDLFKKIYKRGVSVVDPYAVMYFLKNRMEFNRIGITVSKKIGKAVVRNRAKRLLKESFRLMEGNINSGFDIILVARAKTAKANLTRIMTSLNYCFKKAGLMGSRLSAPEKRNERGVK